MKNKGGAPKGNKNAVKPKEWEDAIRRAIKQYSSKALGIKRGDALRQVANKLIEKALEGDQVAIRELGDRLDGKPSQSIVGSPDQPLITKVVQEIVDTQAQGSS